LTREKLPLTVKNYTDLNWWGEVPEEIDEDDLHVLDLLYQYEISQNEKFGTATAREP
jgi:hypothetical protein